MGPISVKWHWEVIIAFHKMPISCNVCYRLVSIEGLSTAATYSYNVNSSAYCTKIAVDIYVFLWNFLLKYIPFSWVFIEFYWYFCCVRNHKSHLQFYKLIWNYSNYSIFNVTFKCDISFNVTPFVLTANWVVCILLNSSAVILI